MNIKNERVHALARRAAAVTGQSQTSAIEEALLLLLSQHGVDPAQDRRAQRLDVINRRLARIDVEVSRTTSGPDAPDITRVEDLYDDVTGLPR
nr:type II toxin-antitoxin system VapB family antitoxin [Kineosphaera limosa]